MSLHRSLDEQPVLVTAVVVVVNIAFNRGNELFSACKSMPIIALTLQDSPEAFHRAVVNAAANTGHTLCHPGIQQFLVEGSAGVGRVMTPVLAMTVVREAAIAAFVPEKFYTVDLELTSGCTASSRRIPEKAVAENLMEACRKEMVATIQRITRKEKSENPPPLYDLKLPDAHCTRQQLFLFKFSAFTS